MRKSIVEDATGLVKNTIVIVDSEISAYPLPTGHSFRDGGAPGHIWNGTSYLPPVIDLLPVKDRKYKEADVEYVKRSLTAAEGVTPGLGKVRGSSPQARLAALFVKANATGNTPLANALAAVHEKLDTLKDAIEAAADATALNAIDVTANTHWA